MSRLVQTRCGRARPEKATSRISLARSGGGRWNGRGVDCPTLGMVEEPHGVYLRLQPVVASSSIQQLAFLLDLRMPHDIVDQWTEVMRAWFEDSTPLPSLPPFHTSGVRHLLPT